MKAKKIIVGAGRVVKTVVLVVGAAVFSKTAVRIALAGVSLGLIAYGLSLYWKPLAFVVPGMLVWVELIRGH